MRGTNLSTVKVTLRNPVDKTETWDYWIIPDNHQLAQDWVAALKELLQSGRPLEKNYCFMGFPETARDLNYLCNELNQYIRQINFFNRKKIWQDAGLSSYIIEDYFTPDVVRFDNDYPIGWDDENLGLSVKHEVMNRLHNHFERLQGVAWNLSEYYKLADYETKYAIRQLNNICHEIETLILSQRKQAVLPDWVRPSQITTFLQAQRYELTPEHRQLFLTNGYDREFGRVYMHWTQVGKTLFEVFRDEHAPVLTDTICEAITELKYYSGEFDIEWGNNVTYGNGMPWHDQEQDRFQQWLRDNNRDPADVNLSLGYLPIGRVDLIRSFGTDNPIEIRKILGKYLDIYQIEVNGTCGQFDYCWSDDDYQQQQIDSMKAGYDFSSRG
jgi:ribonucleotide reductase beta subunit family protein with ferritin-like domain